MCRSSARVVPPSERVVPPSERVVPPSERVVPPSERVVPPSERVVPPSELAVPSLAACRTFTAPTRNLRLRFTIWRTFEVGGLPREQADRLLRKSVEAWKQTNDGGIEGSPISVCMKTGAYDSADWQVGCPPPREGKTSAEGG